MPKKDFSNQTVAASFFSAAPHSLEKEFVPAADQSDLIIRLPIDRLRPYPNQPFRAYTQDKLQELANDIKMNGILSPVIVRPLNGDYQILSGHNRVAAAQLVDLLEVPCMIKAVNDDEATLILVTTNLNQRQELLPSEKAHAYKMQMDAMNRQGKRTDLTLSPRETKLDTAVEISKNESRANVFRYLRLNELSPKLMEKVDTGHLQLKAAVQLSYLTAEQQDELYQEMRDSHIKLNEKKADRLKNAAKESSAPIAELIKNVCTSPEKKEFKPALTKKISIVVPTDENTIEQFKLIKEQYAKESNIHIVIQEIIEKLLEVK